MRAWLLAFPLCFSVCVYVCPYVLSAPRIYVPSTVGGLQGLYLHLTLICYYCVVITTNYYKKLWIVQPSYIKKYCYFVLKSVKLKRFVKVT